MLSAGLPLLFAAYLASVPAYGAHASLLFGFLLLIDAGLLAIALARRQWLLHGVGGLATLLVLAVWLATSYVPVSGARPALYFTLGFIALFAAAPVIGRRVGRPLEERGRRLLLIAPLLAFVFPVLAAIEPTFVRPLPLFAALLVALLLLAWRAVAEPAGAVFYIASFFAIATQAVWSAGHLTEERLRIAVLIYALFGVVSMATPAIARRSGRALQPPWGSGAVLIVSLCLLAFVSLGPVSAATLWALALLLAIMNAGLFVESAAGGLPRVSQVGSLLSWALLGLWWLRSAGSVGVLASLAVMTGLTLITLAGHAWARRQHGASQDSTPVRATFGQGLYLALVGHVFLILIAANREWSLPPWPIFAALAVMTLGTSAASLVTGTPSLHAAGVVGAALVVASWAGAAGSPPWGLTLVAASAAVSAYALGWMRVERTLAPGAACVSLFVSEVAVQTAIAGGAQPPVVAEVAIRLLNIAIILALTAKQGWRFVAIAAVVPAWMDLVQRQSVPGFSWQQLLILAGALYAPFVAYPFLLGSRARDSRDPFVAAVLASAMFFFAGRHAFEAAGLGWAVGIVPIAVAAVLAVLLRRLLALEPSGQRDMGRLALVAGAAMAFVTVAIPLQLHHQWITIGWAFEGAALTWLYRRIPHRGLFYASVALLAVVFVRLALNPAILFYEPRGTLRIVNWYLYTYLACASAMFLSGRWMAGTSDRLFGGLPRVSTLLPGAGAILLFLLLNIEIADYYSTGPTITFRLGTTVSQDLTYTIGWLAFGMLLLAAGIYARSRPARIAAVALIAVTTLKCFLYDLGSLGGLYRVGSFVGLALSLVLVSLALKKFVLSKPKDA